jgi:hypothetical protein
VTGDPLRGIAADLRSPHPYTRVRAVGEARAAAARDPSLAPRVAELLRACVAAADEGRTAVEAARALAALVSEEEAHRVWVALLAHLVPAVAAHAILSTTGTWYLDEMIAASARADSVNVRVSAVRALGRTCDPAALPALLARLDDPDVRPHAVQALGALGDPRAVPHLEALFGDTTEAWEEDNHGPMLRIGDLARDAVRWLPAARPTPLALPPPPRPPGRPALPGEPPDEPPHDPPDRPSGGPPNAPPGASPNASPAESLAEPPRGARREPPGGWARWRVRPLALVPLAVALLELPWLGWVIVGQLYRTGAVARSPAEVQRLDLAVGLPALGGLLLGAALLARWRARTPVERVLLALGCAGCAPFVYAFGGEFLRNR